MNSDIGSEKQQTKKQGGGRLSATLLALFAAEIIAAVFWLTAAVIEPQDELARYVPADAVAYFHFNADRLDPAVRALLALPENVGADEAARAAILDEDRTVRWTTLWHWGLGRRPTEAEKTLLRVLGAVCLDDRTWLLADDRAVRLSTLSFAGDRSLADDIGVSRALATVRGLAPIQGYFNSVIAPPPALPGQAGSLKELDPLVMALDLSNGSFYAAAMPVSAAETYPAFLGFIPDRLPTAPEAPRAGGVAPLVSVLTGGAEPVFDPLAVIFGRVESSRSGLKLLQTGWLEKSQNELRRLLAGPAAVSLYRGSDPTKIDYVAEYPELDRTRLETAVTSYLSAALPERRTINLPDEDVVAEYRFAPQNYVFKAGKGLPKIDTIDIPEIGFKLALADRAEGGIVISTDPEKLLDLASNKSQIPSTADRCLSISGTRLLINKPIIDRLTAISGEPKLDRYLEVIHPDFGLFIDNGNGVLISCGY